jgi:hypothetical protein
MYVVLQDFEVSNARPYKQVEGADIKIVCLYSNHQTTGIIQKTSFSYEEKSSFISDIFG